MKHHFTNQSYSLETRLQLLGLIGPNNWLLTLTITLTLTCGAGQPGSNPIKLQKETISLVIPKSLLSRR